MATALATVQQVFRRMGLPAPSSLVSSDQDGVQALALLNELGQEMTTRWRWQELVRIKTDFTSLNAEDQGTLASILGTGLEGIISLAIWDDTDQKFIEGPLTEQTFLETRATSSGPSYEYKIFNNHLYITPTIPAGHTLHFMYRVNTWALAADGTTYKSEMTLDDDSPLFPDSLIKLGLRWKWREEKGLPYAELMRSFEMQAADLTARNSPSKVLFMANSSQGHLPGIWVSSYNTVPTP